MKIQHNADKVKEFAERILKFHYEDKTKGRTGIHRSDALECPLKCFWRVSGQVKPEFRSKDVGVLMIGEMAHQVLEKGFDAQEKVYDLGGIQVTIDAIAGEYPCEIKTTRKRIFRAADIPKSWVDQLTIGMSVMDVDVGYLMILNIINFSLTVWEFNMSKEERELTRNAFVWQILNILDAIQRNNPDLLKPKYDECEWCVYRPSKQNANCKYYKKSQN